jgi:hypothetical protein
MSKWNDDAEASENTIRRDPMQPGTPKASHNIRELNTAVRALALLTSHLSHDEGMAKRFREALEKGDKETINALITQVGLDSKRVEVDPPTGDGKLCVYIWPLGLICFRTPPPKPQDLVTNLRALSVAAARISYDGTLQKELRDCLQQPSGEEFGKLLDRIVPKPHSLEFEMGSRPRILV